MKNKSAKILLPFLSLGLLCGGLTACGKEGKVWVHFGANDPTEKNRGNVEFWVDKEGNIVLAKPTDGEIVEGEASDLNDYKQEAEIWIENEVKVTKGKNSFVVPLEQLPSVFYDTKTDYSGADFKIIKDVKLKKAWTALGSQDKPFTGTFNGNNKKISNVKIEIEEYYQGFFGVVNGATIKNLKLDKVSIDSWGVAAGLVGFVNGGENVVIENCHVLSGTVKSTEFDDVGGLVGAIYNPTQNVVIKDSSNAAKVESSASPGRVGGIIGLAGPQATLLLENCVNKGQIIGENSAAMIGGTRGLAQGAVFEFKNCSNEGTANVPYVGFVNSSASSQDYLTLKIVNTGVAEADLPTLFKTWRSGGTEGGILTVDLNGSTYKYFLIPTYTYSTSQSKIVSLSPVNGRDHSLDSNNLTEVTAAQWAEFIALNPKAAIYNEDGTFKGVSSTTNCYAPNDYYIKGAGFGGLVNTWVKVN